MSNITVSQQTIQIQVKQSVTMQVAPPAPRPLHQPIKPAKPLFEGDSLSLQVKNASTPTQTIKKLAGGIILGGAGTAIAQSIGSSIVSSGRHFQAKGPSTTGIGLGVALGAGIGLKNIDTGDKTVNNIKNLVSAALIGGSSMGMASAIGKTITAPQTWSYAEGFVSKIASPSTVAIALGATLAVGIAVMNMEE